MMKKLLVSLLTILCLSLMACSNKVNDDTTNTFSEEEISTSLTQNGEDKQDDQQKEEDKQNEQQIENKITFSYSYKVPGKNIVIDVPSYQEMEKGFTQLYILHGERYVAVTAEVNATVQTLNEAHDVAFAFFKEAIQNYSYVNSLNVILDSTESINGIEVYKYEGTLSCALDYSNRDNAYDAYVIGYSFIMDGVPCTITGSVIDQDQEQDMIDEMKATVEAMIKTLRSER